MSTIEFTGEDLESAGTWQANVADIQRAVGVHFGVKSAALASKDRHKRVALARHVAMYVCRARLKLSYPELGRAFGGRDHSTAMSAVTKIALLRAENPEVLADLLAIDRRLS